MAARSIFLGFFGLILALSIVSASSYSIDYSQVGNRIVIKEVINGAAQESYTADGLLEKSRDGFYFVERLNFSEDYDEVQATLNLDTGFIAEKEGVFPFGYETKTDGQTISVIWKLKDVKSGDVFPMFVKITDTRKSYGALWIILAAVLLFIVAYLIYRKAKMIIKPIAKAKIQPRKKKTAEKAEAKYEYLLDTEKKIIEELKKADRHELWQKQIQDSTGYSKAKVSRLIRNLESRGLIAKIPFGNTNKVRLK